MLFYEDFVKKIDSTDKIQLKKFENFSRKNDLTNYWALGPFVRPFTSLVDPGDIYPPQAPDLWVDLEVINPKIHGPRK